MNYAYSTHSMMRPEALGPNLLSSYPLNEAVLECSTWLWNSRSLTSQKTRLPQSSPRTIRRTRLVFDTENGLTSEAWIAVLSDHESIVPANITYYLPPQLASIGLRRCPVTMCLTHHDAKGLSTESQSICELYQPPKHLMPMYYRTTS